MTVIIGSHAASYAALFLAQRVCVFVCVLVCVWHFLRNFNAKYLGLGFTIPVHPLSTH